MKSATGAHSMRLGGGALQGRCGRGGKRRRGVGTCSREGWCWVGIACCEQAEVRRPPGVMRAQLVCCHSGQLRLRRRRQLYSQLAASHVCLLTCRKKEGVRVRKMLSWVYCKQASRQELSPVLSPVRMKGALKRRLLSGSGAISLHSCGQGHPTH